MTDKFRIGFSPLADFSTAPWGVLKVVDGVVVLDEEKAFNRSRKAWNAGGNLQRILRRGIWETVLPFDFDSPGYFYTLKRYCEVVHQPVQGPPTGEGAVIQIDLFDGCSETWMYDPANWQKCRDLMRGMFETFKDVPYVVFCPGNEMNTPESVPFVRDLVFPEFQLAGRIPFATGACYSRNDDWLEFQKKESAIRWGDEVESHIYRSVHGVMDRDSFPLTDTVGFWMPANNPISILWGTDGVWNGANECDWAPRPGGLRHARPSPDQVKSAMRFWIENARSFALIDGHPKFGFEYLPKVVNADDCVMMGVRAISDIHFERFGVWPVNFGKYEKDWVAPVPPECKLGDVKRETCWNGEEIITHTCEDGKWVPTGSVCPEKPPAPKPCKIEEWLEDNWGWILVVVVIVAVIIVIL